LVIAAGEAVGGPVERALPAAVALEMIHTYSLIHDDLPAMDNDAFRRGRPTSHTVYGEAMAILAGDGLLTFAFELLAGEAIRQGWDPALSLRILHELAIGAGPRGMVGGQVLDIALEGKSVDLKTLEAIHSSKTGAMIRASVRIGALLGGADPVSVECLTSYAERIGLAFQVADDILDVEGDASLLGKRTHKDAEQKKNTYPSLIGLQQAKDLRDGLIRGGIQDLAGLGDSAEPLRGIARYIADRNR
jgi:geranylgeranyl diphosphate synthase type II